METALSISAAASAPAVSPARPNLAALAGSVIPPRLVPMFLNVPTALDAAPNVALVAAIVDIIFAIFLSLWQVFI
jgi:hypothetical protein